MLDGVTIIQADFADTLARVRDMGGADLILTSPPYADARTYGAGVSWTMADYQRLGDAIKPALKPGGHCLMVLDAPVREWRPGYGTERGFLPWQVMLDWAERVGLRVPDRLAYGRMGQVGAFSGRFRNDWEPLLWFQRPGLRGYFQALVERGKTGPYIATGGGTREQDGTYVRQGRAGEMAEQGLRYRGTLWYYTMCGAIQGEQGHPATYALRFAEDAVRCFCTPGGLVCDPFTGSGTSAVAAAKHGRRFFGGDLLVRPSDGKPWAQVALERAIEATRQQTLPLGGAA